ncbi:hypothetical protein [Cognatiyoonia koreensis]|nr:hypothetical protein [Cognatiyoonia koreensis]
MRILLFVFLTAANPCFADLSSPEAQLRTFANCAGRLTAQLEFEWLMLDGNSAATQEQRQQIVDILNSMIPDGRGREVLAWRTDARAAQRGLLERAQFASDNTDAAWAKKAAARYLASCTAFLLS